MKANWTHEAQARAEIVAYGRLLYERRLVAGTSGNISLRLNSGDILITPTRRSLRTLSPGDLVRTDPAGEPRNPAQFPSSEFPLHLALYKVRDDVQCLIHTHPPFVTAWSKFGTLFPLDTVGATESLGSITITRFERPGSAELAQVCAEAFAAGTQSVVMQRHGLSVAGRTLEDAFMRTDLAEATAAIEYYARALG